MTNMTTAEALAARAERHMRAETTQAGQLAGVDAVTAARSVISALGELATIDAKITRLHEQRDHIVGMMALDVDKANSYCNSKRTPYPPKKEKA